MNLVWLSVFQAVIILLIAPLVPGLVQFFRARFQGRHGLWPWRWHTAYASIWRQEILLPPGTTWLYWLMPGGYFLSLASLTLLLPLVVIGTNFGGLTSIVLIGTILPLSSAFLVIGALDSGSSLAGMGGSRYLTLIALFQPTVLVVFLTLALATGSTDMMAMLRFGTEQGQLILTAPYLLLSVVALCLVALGEAARYPLDNPVTRLELTMVSKALSQGYSGPLLVLIEYAAAIKLTVLAVLIANFIWPGPLLTWPLVGLDVVLSLPVLALKLIVIMFGLALLESTLTRIRFYRVQEFLTGAFFLALSGLVLGLLKIAL